MEAHGEQVHDSERHEQGSNDGNDSMASNASHASLTSTIFGGEDTARDNDLRKMRKEFNAKIEAFKNEYDTIAAFHIGESETAIVDKAAEIDICRAELIYRINQWIKHLHTIYSWNRNDQRVVLEKLLAWVKRVQGITGSRPFRTFMPESIVRKAIWLTDDKILPPRRETPLATKRVHDTTSSDDDKQEQRPPPTPDSQAAQASRSARTGGWIGSHNPGTPYPSCPTVSITNPTGDQTALPSESPLPSEQQSLFHSPLASGHSTVIRGTRFQHIRGSNNPLHRRVEHVRASESQNPHSHITVPRTPPLMNLQDQVNSPHTLTMMAIRQQNDQLVIEEEQVRARLTEKQELLAKKRQEMENLQRLTAQNTAQPAQEEQQQHTGNKEAIHQKEQEARRASQTENKRRQGELEQIRRQRQEYADKLQEVADQEVKCNTDIRQMNAQYNEMIDAVQPLEAIDTPAGSQSVIPTHERKAPPLTSPKGKNTKLQPQKGRSNTATSSSDSQPQPPPQPTNTTQDPPKQSHPKAVTFHNQPSTTFKKPQIHTSAKLPPPQTEQGRTNESYLRARQMAIAQAKDQRPAVKFEAGTAVAYVNHMRRFEEAVNNPDMNSRLKLIELGHWFSGDANIIIESCAAWDDDDTAYASALSELETLFNQIDDTISPSLAQAAQGGQIKEHDHKAHLHLYSTLHQIRATASALDKMQDLDRQDLINNIVKNRLDHMRSDINKQGAFLRRFQQRDYGFMDLLTGVQDHLGILQRTRPSTSQSARVGATDASSRPNQKNQRPNETEKQTQSLDTDKCGICQNNHSTQSCTQLTSLAVNDRAAKLKDKGLCFHCLSHGHLARSCPDIQICTICNGRHNTILHGRERPDIALHQRQNPNQNANNANSNSGQRAPPIPPLIPAANPPLPPASGSSVSFTGAVNSNGSTIT